MRRLGIAILAIAALTARPDFSSFPPRLEQNAAHAQKKDAAFSQWLKEDGCSELEDADEATRLNAAWKIRYAIEDGSDISPAVPALSKALKDSNPSVKTYAAFALEMHYLRRKDWAKAASLLNHEDNEVRSNSSWALGSAAEKRLDLSAFAAQLQKGLKNDNEFVRWNASKALTLGHLSRGEQGKAARLLNSDNEDIRQGAEEAERLHRKR